MGIVLLGLTMLDADQGVSRSTLTWLLGATGSDSPAHAVSAAIAWVATAAWLVGYVFLVLTWAFARPARPLQDDGQLAVSSHAALAVDERPDHTGSSER